MLEEDFTGDERHEAIPINFTRVGFLSKRARSNSVVSLFVRPWNIRTFNLRSDQVLEYWEGMMGYGKKKGEMNVRGAFIDSLDPKMCPECDGKSNVLRIVVRDDSIESGVAAPIIVQASSKAEADDWLQVSKTLSTEIWIAIFLYRSYLSQCCVLHWKAPILVYHILQ